MEPKYKNALNNIPACGQINEERTSRESEKLIRGIAPVETEDDETDEPFTDDTTGPIINPVTDEMPLYLTKKIRRELKRGRITCDSRRGKGIKRKK